MDFLRKLMYGHKRTRSLSPEQQYQQLLAKEGATASDIQAVFDTLQPIKPEQLIGSWKGRAINTGHPAEEILSTLRWAGKDVRSTEDIDPIMVYDEEDKRVYCPTYGRARPRLVEWEGKSSAALIYDDVPIIDHFRYVNEDLIAGIMDAKPTYLEGGTFYFYLYR